MRKILLLILITCSMLTGTLIVASSIKAQESTQTSITVQTIPGPTVSQKLAARASGSWSWYITRGSGIVAAILLVILLLSGIGQITGYTFRFLEPLTAWASHRALGIMLGVAILLHIFSLLFDKFVPFNLLQLFVPWLSHYKPVSFFGFQFGSLYVALGVLAFYLTAAVIITSLVWVDKKPYVWKLIHLLSYLIMLFVFIHALYLGTDVAHGLLRIIWIGLGTLIAVLCVQRLWRAKTT